MDTLILACSVYKYELAKAMEETGCIYPIQWVDADRTTGNPVGLHAQPEKLNIHLQGLLDKVANINQLLLCFGFCGKALVGLKASSFQLIVPRVDDCITMFLGSREKRKELAKEMGTYFYTKSWVEFQGHIWNVYKQDFCGRFAERVGKERAEHLFFKTCLPDKFKRLGVIDTGAYDLEEIIEKTQEMAKDLRLCHQVIPGTIGYIKKLLTGPWDDDFIVVNPGETISLSHVVGELEQQ